MSRASRPAVDDLDELLGRAAGCGLVLSVEDGRLVVRGPAAARPVVEALRRRRDEVVGRLAGGGVQVVTEGPRAPTCDNLEGAEKPRWSGLEEGFSGSGCQVVKVVTHSSLSPDSLPCPERPDFSLDERQPRQPDNLNEKPPWRGREAGSAAVRVVGVTTWSTQAPTWSGSEAAEYIYFERLGVAEDMGLDTSAGSAAELVARAEADAVEDIEAGGGLAADERRRRIEARVPMSVQLGAVDAALRIFGAGAGGLTCRGVYSKDELERYIRSEGPRW